MLKLNTHNFAFLMKQIPEPLTGFPSVQRVHVQEGVVGEHLSKDVHFATMITTLILKDGNLIHVDARHGVSLQKTEMELD